MWLREHRVFPLLVSAFVIMQVNEVDTAVFGECLNWEECVALDRGSKPLKRIESSGEAKEIRIHEGRTKSVQGSVKTSRP